MDEASADLFGYLSTALQETSWLWCVTRRDEESGFVAPLEFAARIRSSAARRGGSDGFSPDGH